MELSEILTTRQRNVLATKNIFTPEDLVLYTPKVYRDYRKLQLVKDADPNRYGIFNGTLIFCDKRAGKKWYMVMRMVQDDGTQVLFLMFNETFRFEEFSKLINKRITICGKPQYDEYGWSIKYPEHLKKEEDFVPHIEPVYTKIKNLSDEALLKSIDACIPNIQEPLDRRIFNDYNLIEYQDALKLIHHPKTDGDIRTGKSRLLLNDMLYYAESLGKAEEHGTENSSFIINKLGLAKQMIASLPYKLTDDQKNVLNKFYTTVSKGKRFNTLIQGDVGCGKTIVAIAMMIMSVESGYQSVLMAPREVLAKQHFDEVLKLTEPLGIKAEFLSSSITGKKKEAIIENIKNGSTNILVGTHSCIADAVEYQNLGLIVTDEEHLFGVKQKEKLEAKSDKGIHSVSMSATPIPRSLATILYGNKKEIMSIHTMPNGRLPIKTAIQTSHQNVFPFMEKEIKDGRQCYVVCPAIEENDEYGITSIEEMEEIYRKHFEEKGMSLGVVHGKKDSKEIAETIDLFADGKLDILMSTTVIEVGVNVPNTTVMVIEQAERFGLASLHQLRGRVGRSNMQSYCILVSKDRFNARLQTMVSTNDGFIIAEEDLKQRGSGDLLGVRQAGNNRFVNEMIRHPLLFQSAIEMIKKCNEKGYTNHFEWVYGENAESVGEDI